MATPSDADAATEALIARMVADDEDYFDQSLQFSHSPNEVGASYHDYEDPMTSYERQLADGSSENGDDGSDPPAAPSLNPVPVAGSPQPPLELSPSEGWDFSEAQGSWSAGESEHGEKTVGDSGHNELRQTLSAPAVPSSHQIFSDVHNLQSPVSDPEPYTSTFPRARRNTSLNINHHDLFSKDPSDHIDGPVDFQRHASEQSGDYDQDNAARGPKYKGKGKERALDDGWGPSSQISSQGNWQWGMHEDEERNRLQQILRDGEYFDENGILHLVVPWPYPEMDEETEMREKSEVVEIHLDEEDGSSETTAMSDFSGGGVKTMGEAIGC